MQAEKPGSTWGTPQNKHTEFRVFFTLLQLIVLSLTMQRQKITPIIVVIHHHHHQRKILFTFVCLPTWFGLNGQ